MHQLSMRYQADSLKSAVWSELLEAIRQAVTHVGVKEAAYQLDTSPSSLSNALAERERRCVKAEWLPYLISVAPNDRIVELLADLRHCDVQRRPELTAEQRLERLEDAIKQNVGPRIQREIFGAAFGWGSTR